MLSGTVPGVGGTVLLTVKLAFSMRRMFRLSALVVPRCNILFRH